ncbi:MAG TPA: haloacid dehalogenase-like hydrolase [Micromonosporaceae bacterium]|nr:haloacid dehalogenase-like hydrolase [Micromonosporaceae bacterium]
MGSLTIGFDLDMTLVDSRPGIAATYRAITELTGVYVDAELAVTRLGPPLEVELANWFPPEQVAHAAATYRSLYRDHAIACSPPLPGAVDAFAAVRAAGGRVLVVTAKNELNARHHLAHLGLTADAVVGFAWADGKVAALRAHQAVAYIGDHVADMAASLGAGAYPVGVATGPCTVEELYAAGARAVLPDLTAFPAWLDRGCQPPPAGI